jgi:hypothetical protein
MTKVTNPLLADADARRGCAPEKRHSYATERSMALAFEEPKPVALADDEEEEEEEELDEELEDDDLEDDEAVDEEEEEEEEEEE